MKRFVKITITLLISVSIIAILFIGALFYLKNNQTQILLNQVQKTINTSISVEKINISIFKHFPNIDISFYNVQLSSAQNYNHTKNDTISYSKLLEAHEIDISFDVFKLLFKNKYIIKGISLKDGYLSLKQNSLNQKNYLIFVSKSSKDSLNLNIKYFYIKNLKLVYYDEQKSLYFETYINKGKFTGDLMEKNLESFASINSIKFINNYHSIKFLSPLNLNIKISHKNNSYLLDRLNIIYNKNNIGITGNLNENNKDINLNIHSEKFNFKNFNEFTDSSEIVKDLFGKISFDGNFKSNLNNTKNIDIYFSFNLNNIGFSYKNLSFKKINGPIILKFHKFLSFSTPILNCSLNNSSLSLSNFYYFGKTDSLNGKVNINLNSNDINQITKIESVSLNKGNISIESQLNTTLKTNNINNLIFSLFENCELSFSDVCGVVKGINFNSINGKSIIESNQIKVKELKGDINNYFTIYYGNITGLIPVLRDSVGKINITGTYKSDYVNVDTLLSFFSSSEKKSKNGDITLNMHLEIDEVIYHYTAFKNFKSDLSYSNNKIFINGINATALKGKLIDNNLELEFKKDTLNIISDNTFYQVDIKKLFTTLDNFGQNQISSENISGKLSGNCILKLILINNQISKKNISLHSNLELTDGTLENYKPLYKLSGLINLKELSSIEFSTIKNNIIIENNIIKIPQVDIKSSALNLTLAGQHSFDSKFEYHIKVHLSELLSKKFNKQKENKNEFGQVELDTLHRICMYFKFFGDSSNNKFDYESKREYNIFLNNKKQKSSISKSLKTEFRKEIEENNNSSKIESEFNVKSEKEKKKKSNHSIEWKDE